MEANDDDDDNYDHDNDDDDDDTEDDTCYVYSFLTPNVTLHLYHDPQSPPCAIKRGINPSTPTSQSHQGRALDYTPLRR